MREFSDLKIAVAGTGYVVCLLPHCFLKNILLLQLM